MMAAVPLVTLPAIALYGVTLGGVGYARRKYGVKAPATTGDEMFERHFRVQMNTLEQLALFLPSLWIFGAAWPKADNAVYWLGGLWLVGRLIYMVTYVKDPSRRSVGFSLAFAATLILYIGAVAGVISFYL